MYLGQVKRGEFLLLFLLLFSQLLYSQDVENRYVKTEALTINNGLSQGMVNCMLQDQYGFIWIGTNDGLNRFDGFRITVYRNDVTDPNTISGNYITTIHEDVRGLLWIGTGLNGVNIFNRQTENFIHVAGLNESGNSASRILSIQEDAFGTIWIGTTDGLFKVIILPDKAKPSTGKYTDPFIVNNSIVVRKFDFNSFPGIKDTFQFNDETTGKYYFEPTMFFDSKGKGWITAVNGSYQLIPSANGTDKLIPLPGRFNRDDTIVAENSNIFNMLEDTVSSSLYLMRKGYVSVINQKTVAIKHIAMPKLGLGIYRSPSTIHEGKILAAVGGKVYHYDFNKNKIYLLQSKSADHQIIMNNANITFKDRSGIIWIGSKGYGLVKINPRTEKFNELNIPSVLWMTALKNNAFLSLYQSEIFRLSLSGERKYVVDTLLQGIYRLIKSRNADAIVQDSQGGFYVNASGIYYVSPDVSSFKVISKEKGCFPLYIDSKNNLWYGNNHSFCRYDALTGNISSYTYPVRNMVLSPYKFLEIIYEDGDEFWLGTVNGLLNWNSKTLKWKHYSRNGEADKSLSADVIFTVCNDAKYPHDFLWIGTNGGGLNCLNKKTGVVKKYSLKEGLPNTVVYGVLSDNLGRLWLSTNKGISCFTPKYDVTNNVIAVSGGTFKNYEENDGLQSNEFNRYGYSKGKDGTLLFGGINGINYFHPGDIKVNNYIPEVLITDFRLSNSPVIYNAFSESNDANSILHKPVFLTSEITLPFDKNMISFGFAAMDFTSVARNSFRYKLENFDKAWVDAGNINSATYTNLDPGTYLFKVVGSNNDGVWNMKGASIKLTILPPWYMTWWFRLLLALLVVVSIYIIYRVRLNQALHLLKVRNSIASDLHDEIGSTLSSVYIYSEVASKSVGDSNPEAQDMMKNISSEVAGMIDALSDIVWTVNAKNDRFENIMNRMHATSVELCEAQNYQLHFNMDESLNNLKMGMENRRNFYLIFKEAINNVVKYANGNNVWITLRQDSRKEIIFIIRDDGQGFDLNARREGNGLVNIMKRTAELNGNIQIISAPGEGTEIQLQFPNS